MSHTHTAGGRGHSPTARADRQDQIDAAVGATDCTMPGYTVETPEREERGIRVTCEAHGDSEEFPPGRRRVAFYCEGCGYELEVTVHDTHEWRDMGEMC